MLKKLSNIFTFIYFLTAFSALSGEDFTWEPVTEADWAVAQDSAKGIRDAVMIFEKIVADDSKLIDEKCYLYIYCRIRVLSAEGRKWADVTAPYYHKKEKVEEIGGRTLLRDGTVISINREQIIEKEIVKAKGIKIKQKSFSLPAVSDDCIIEYYFKYRLPYPRGIWLIQKEIHLLEGKYTWEFYSGQSLKSYEYARIADIITPNFLWLNTDKKLDVTYYPSLKEAEKVIFKITDVAAFESEPYSLPDIGLKAQLRCYYGESMAPAAYWGDLSKSISDGLDEFTKKNKKVREIVEGFGIIENREEKIKTAYNWLQENIQNTAYSDEEEESFKDNNNVDDVIKRGYGTSRDINKTFYDMLREMNLDAKMVYVTDRDDNFFVYDAKYWQFDRSLVAIPGEDGGYEFYNPGALFMPLGSVAWFNEETYGFIVGEMKRQFYRIPYSDSRANKINRFQELKLDENMQLSGKLIEKHKGHSARSIRVDLWKSTEKEKTDYLQDLFSERFSSAETDSITVEDIENTSELLTVKCNVSHPSAGQQMGNRLLLKPYTLFGQHENPFQSENRKYPIMFDYAEQVMEAMRIDLPENWSIEALPADTAFSNQAGSCQVIFRNINDGKSLSIQCIYILNAPSWNAEQYKDLRDLFRAQQSFGEITVVLKNEGV